MDHTKTIERCSTRKVAFWALDDNFTGPRQRIVGGSRVFFGLAYITESFHLGSTKPKYASFIINAAVGR